MPTAQDRIEPANDHVDNRLRGFAKFFKSYMGVMPLVTAAFAPVVTFAKVLPVYEAQSKSLAVFSGLLGFLAVAWVFYARQGFARFMFPMAAQPIKADPFKNTKRVISWCTTALPLICIVFSVGSYFEYSVFLNDSVETIQVRQLYRGRNTTTGSWDQRKISDIVNNTPIDQVPKRKDVLQQTDISIPYGPQLAGFYLAIFFFAEFAFVVMATREYLQDVIALSDLQLIKGITSGEKHADAPGTVAMFLKDPGS